MDLVRNRITGGRYYGSPKFSEERKRWIFITVDGKFVANLDRETGKLVPDNEWETLLENTHITGRRVAEEETYKVTIFVPIKYRQAIDKANPGKPSAFFRSLLEKYAAAQAV